MESKESKCLTCCNKQEMKDSNGGVVFGCTILQVLLPVVQDKITLKVIPNIVECNNFNCKL